MRARCAIALCCLITLGTGAGLVGESPISQSAVDRVPLPDDVGELSALRETRFAEFAAAAKAQQRPEMLQALQRLVEVDRKLRTGAERDIPDQIETVNVFRDRYLDSANSLARMLISAGKFPDALPVRRELATVCMARWGVDHWRSQEARTDLADLERMQTLSPEQREVLAEAASLNRQVLQQYEQGVPAQALAAAQRACELRRQVLGDVHRDYAASLNNLALLNAELGRFAEAEALYQQVAEVFRTAWGETHPQYGTVLSNLGELYREWGRYAEAEQHYLRSLKIDEQALGKRHAGYATGLNNLALLYQATGRAAEAEPLFRESLAVIRDVLGERHPQYASGLNNLAQSLQAQADYESARRLYEQAVDLKREILGREHPDYAVGLSTLGAFLMLTGDFAAAESRLQEAVSILERAIGREHPTYLHALNHLARLYEQIGSYDRAEQLYRQSLETRRRVLGETHPDFATSLNNLGTLYAGIGRPADAVPLLQQALAVWHEAVGENHPKSAMTLNNLAAATANTGDHNTARRLHEQALDVQQRLLGAKHPDVAQSLGNLALMHLHDGDYKRAEKLFSRAADMYQEIGGREHPRYALIVSNLGATRQLAGDPAQGARQLAEAYRLTFENLEQTAVVLSESRQLALAQSVQHRLHTYFSCLLECTGRAEEAYAAVLHWKGAALLRQRAVRLAASDPELAPQLEQLQDVTRQWSALLRLDAASRTPAVASRVTELSRRKETLESQLARRSAAYRSTRETVSIAQLQSALPPGAVLVDYFEFWRTLPGMEPGVLHRFERSLAAFVVRRDGPVEMFDLGAMDPIAAEIETWRKSFGLESAGLQAGHMLRARLWQPLQPAVGDAATVLISPDGALGRIPFAALPGNRPDTYLLEDHRLTLAPVPRLIADAAARSALPARSAPEYELLLVGNVDYDRAAPETPDESHPTFAAATSPELAENGALAGAVPWSPLPGTAEEIASIQQLWTGVDPHRTGVAEALERDRATEHTWRRLAPRARILHLATHGFFAPPEQKSALSVSPQLASTRSAIGNFEPVWAATGASPGLLSGIVFAGANRAATPLSRDGSTALGDDGILTAEEVSALRLPDAELVVLSACETGLGAVAGGEGVLGIQRAFQIAGVPTTVTTLWQVDDAVTRRLMEEFYRRLLINPQSPLDALREAQLWVLRNPQDVARTIESAGTRGDVRLGSRPATPERTVRTPPYYWAPFVLSGDRP